MTVGDRIRALREKLGISQVDFAGKINVSKQTLYKYENNIITNIPSDKIEAAAKIGNVSPAYLMGWDNTPPPPAPEHSIEKIIDATKEQLLTQDGLTLEGRPACPESIDSVLTSMTIGVEMAKQKNRKIPEPKELTRTQKVPAVPDYMKAEAAHLRTDIEVTPEQIQADDDIMNDDSEWT